MSDTPIADEEKLTTMTTLAAMGDITTANSALVSSTLEPNKEPQKEEQKEEGNTSSESPKITKTPQTEKEIDKEKKYHRKVADAYEQAQGAMMDALEDRSMDIYQYCAFLSTNSYHVSPKSAQLVASSSQHGSTNANANADGVLEHATTSIDHATTNLGNDFGNDFGMDDVDGNTQRSSHARRESINRFSVFTTDRLRKAVPRKYRITKAMYYWAMVKAALVLGLQLTAVIVAMADLLDKYDVNTDSSVCSQPFHFPNTYKTIRKFLFAGFCAMLAMSITNTIHELKESAFYSALLDDECLFPDLIDKGWLVAGRTTNYLVLIIVTWSSFLIIFFSTRVLDMVVNSAAVFFVLQLDNMVIGTEQRKVVRNYLDVYEWELKKRADAFIRKKKNQSSEMEQQEENKRKEWNVVKIFFDLISWSLSTAIVSPAVYLTSFLAFIFVPLFMVVCA